MARVRNGGPGRRSRHGRGAGLLEAVVVVALVATAASAAIPRLDVWRSRHRLRGAIQAFHLTVEALRAGAIASGSHRGIDFSDRPDGLTWRIVADADGDGILRADLRRGIDRIESPWFALEERHAGVLPGRPPGVPGVSGSSVSAGAIAFGRSSIVSCAPDGSSSSGTLYLHVGRGEAAALRLYGATGRSTLWWWEPEAGLWRALD